MDNLMNIDKEVTMKEEMYLLIGDIPVERMYIIESNDASDRPFDMEKKENDIKSRFYFKFVNSDESFTMNSIDEDPYQEHYYFGYSEDEIEIFNQSFIGLREFLARASYVGRQFEPTTEYYAYSLYQGNAMRVEELEAIENMHDSRLLVCVLGNKVLVKNESIITSGFSFVDIKDTPLANESFYKFVSEKEDLPYTHDDIVEGIKEDLQQNISANFDGPSYN